MRTPKEKKPTPPTLVLTLPFSSVEEATKVRAAVAFYIECKPKDAAIAQAYLKRLDLFLASPPINKKETV